MGDHQSTSRRTNKALNIVEGPDHPAYLHRLDTDLVLVRFGRGAGYRYWPELLSDRARRLDESASAKAP
jgi:hypothetical protein